MTHRYTLAQRTPALNTVFAGLACAITLALAAGPALAEPVEMQRVEVRGRTIEAPVRYDVRAECSDFDDQMLGTLTRTWEREARYGEVKVQFVMENGFVTAVEADGISSPVARDVRHAVARLRCDEQAASADARVYRFSVDFINPNAPRDTQLAGAASRGVRVSMVSR